MLEEIERRLAEGIETGKFEGLLFHGSGEPWNGEPRVGGDGIFWTSRSAVIAQQYISASGSSCVVPKLDSWELNDRVMPLKHSFWADVARRMTGRDCLDVEFDKWGNLSSWRYPPGWPTQGECASWLETELGYDWGGRDFIQVKTDMSEGVERLMPADWVKQGTMLVTLADDLTFRDLRRGSEGDLTDLEYHDHEAFEAAYKAGFDGVVINDFAQSDEGNLGHVSYGLTPHALAKLEWVAMPARRHVYDMSQQDDLTADLREWAASRIMSRPQPMAGGNRP